MNPRRQAGILQQRRTHHLASNADAYALFNLKTGPAFPLLISAVGRALAAGHQACSVPTSGPPPEGCPGCEHPVQGAA